LSEDQFRAFAEKPAAKSLLLPQFGDQKMPPQGASIPNRLTAWTFPQIAADPKERSNLLFSPTNLDAPTGKPVWRFDQYAGPTCSRANP